MEKIILVIDDDADDRDLFREALFETYKSIQLVCANNGYEALELFNRPGHIIPDIIFLDLNMPRMDGRQCLIRLRAMPALQEVPIIIFSTLKLTDEAEEFKQLGAAMYVTKPLWYGDLKKTIHAILSAVWNIVDLGKK